MPASLEGYRSCSIVYEWCEDRYGKYSAAKLIAFLIVTGIGGVLGRIVGGLLFRPSDGRPPDHPPYD